MQKARSHPIHTSMYGLLPLVSARFQVLFHSSVRSTFHLSLTVLVHYRSLRSIQPYQMVLADSHKISHVPRYSGYYQVINSIRIQDYHLLWFNFPENSTSNLQSTMQSYNQLMAETIRIWAIPCSLAATQGITIVFYSSRYLDVSVPWVDFPTSRDNTTSWYWVSPFGNLRIKGYLHLPEAYRSLSRPSSSLRAKAFAMRPYLLS